MSHEDTFETTLADGSNINGEARQIEIPAIKPRITVGGYCGKCGAPYLMNVGIETPGVNDIRPVCKCWNTGTEEVPESKAPAKQAPKPRRDMFSERLEAARVRRKLNKSELAERIGVSKQCIGHWEGGEGLRPYQNIRALCKALKVSADYLLGLKEEP